MDTRYKGYRLYLAYSGKFVVTINDADARTRRKFKTESAARAFIDPLPTRDPVKPAKAWKETGSEQLDDFDNYDDAWHPSDEM